MSNTETSQENSTYGVILPERMIVLSVKPLDMDSIMFKGRLLPLSNVPPSIIEWLKGKTFQEATEEIYSIIQALSHEPAA